MNVTISIDDLHPQKGWGLSDDPQMEMLELLNEEFGCKFTLFIPSNYHKQYPLSEHKYWTDWLQSKPYFELAAHGHYHQCNRPDLFGEMEFAELQNPEEISQRISDMHMEWNAIGYRPAGWRNPGWIASNQSINALQLDFEWVALHDQHNHGREWFGPRMLFGHTGINESSIQHTANTIMFQSHIAGDWNNNVWNRANFSHFREILAFMINKLNYPLEFKTLSEL